MSPGELFEVADGIRCNHARDHHVLEAAPSRILDCLANYAEAALHLLRAALTLGHRSRDVDRVSYADSSGRVCQVTPWSRPEAHVSPCAAG
eukprot:5933057-Prymnesium_polylepis.1